MLEDYYDSLEVGLHVHERDDGTKKKYVQTVERFWITQ